MEERGWLVWRIHLRITAAYRAHMAALDPPSNYCQSLAQMAQASGDWTDGQLRAFALLMRGAGCCSWDPDSWDWLNWLYIETTRQLKRRWESLSVEDLQHVLADLEV